MFSLRHLVRSPANLKYLCAARLQPSGRYFSDDKDKKPSLYDSLGLQSSATHSEIKKAYYDLSFKFHPDRNEGNADASTRFREVTEAYEVLGNYGMRKRYDKGLPLEISKIERPEPRDIVEVDLPYQKFFDKRSQQARPRVPFEEEEEIPKENWQQKRLRLMNEHFRESEKMQPLLGAILAILILIRLYEGRYI